MFAAIGAAVLLVVVVLAVLLLGGDDGAETSFEATTTTADTGGGGFLDPRDLPIPRPDFEPTIATAAPVLIEVPHTVGELRASFRRAARS